MSLFSEVYEKKLKKFKEAEEAKKHRKEERKRLKAEKPKVRKKYVLRKKRRKKCKNCRLVYSTRTGVYCLNCAHTIRIQKQALQRAKRYYEPTEFEITDSDGKSY